MTPQDIIDSIKCLIRARRPFFLWGPPGVGKSAFVRAVADEVMTGELIDLRAITLDPVDLRGLPAIDNGKTVWTRPGFMPCSGKGILFADELNAAPTLTQAGFYQLAYDRQLGDYALPQDWYFCAAGNNDTDGAVTSRMPTPLRSRFVHLVIPTVENKKYPGCLTFANIADWVEQWSKWATQAELHPTVIAHARAVPELLYLFDKNARTFPCPRTWQYLSDVVNAQPPASVEYQIFEGTVGGPAANSFYTFLKMFRELPDMDEIIKEPKKAVVPSDDPSLMFLIASALASKANAKNFKNILQYCDRIPPEYSVLTVKDSVTKTAALATTKEFTDWAMKHQDFVL